MKSEKQKYIFEKTVEINCDIDKLFKFHLDTNNLPKISPGYPSARIKSISEVPLIEGSTVTVTLNFGLFKSDWKIQIKELVPNKLIGDLQVNGLFEYWYHSHIFDLKDGSVVMTDKVEYLPPFGLFGKMLLPFIKLQLNSMFKYRHQKTKMIFES